MSRVFSLSDGSRKRIQRAAACASICQRHALRSLPENFQPALSPLTFAHNPHGKAALIIELGAVGHFLPFTSEAALIEAERNLAAKYPHAQAFLKALMNDITLAAADPSAAFPDGLPVRDAVIFQAARSCHAAHFLTGDLPHFGPLMNRADATFSITIETVAQFLSAMQ